MESINFSLSFFIIILSSTCFFFSRLKMWERGDLIIRLINSESILNRWSWLSIFERDMWMPIVIRSAMLREKTRGKWRISGDALESCVYRKLKTLNFRKLHCIAGTSLSYHAKGSNKPGKTTQKYRTLYSISSHSSPWTINYLSFIFYIIFSHMRMFVFFSNGQSRFVLN